MYCIEIIPRRFVTIDPGLQASGYAVWDDGSLVRCGLLRARPKTKGLTARLQEQKAAWSEVCRYLACEGGFEAVVAERMVHRHFRGNKVDPNDLINLSIVTGLFGTHYVSANEWKGTVPRDVEQSHSYAVMTPFERALVEAVLPSSLRKEAWSAVGIGLSILGRAHQQVGWRFS